MTLAVWSIALLHGFFVFIVAEITKSRIAVAIAAVIAVAVGVLTGSPIYMALDLLFVAIATYLCWTDLAPLRAVHRRLPRQERARQERIKADEQRARFRKEVGELLTSVLSIGAVIAFLVWKFWEPSELRPVAAPVATPSPAAALAPPVRNANPAAKTAQQVRPTSASEKKPRRANKPAVQKCLEIADEQAMTRCLERAP